ncbi:MAG TPA: hypothetical protein VFB01_05530 [Burkholderiales bacterium]|nr:hypothetical protein [Burkholderiales bacterium]
MYEHRTQPLLPRREFYGRVAQNGALAAGIVAFSLAVGMLGYHLLERLPWLDSFLNAAMLLGGMGPVDAPRTAAGKLFAGLYALYCGLVVLVSASIILAPVAHRFLHRFHLEQQRARAG